MGRSVWNGTVENGPLARSLVRSAALVRPLALPRSASLRSLDHSLVETCHRTKKYEKHKNIKNNNNDNDNNNKVILAKLSIFDTVILWESFIVFISEQLSHSITVPNIDSYLYIIYFNYILIILAKLAIFDTVILWESFIVFICEQLSHSITVPNINSLLYMTYFNYTYILYWLN